MPGWLAWYFQNGRGDLQFSIRVMAVTVALALGIAAVAYAFGASFLPRLHWFALPQDSRCLGRRFGAVLGLVCRRRPRGFVLLWLLRGLIFHP